MCRRVMPSTGASIAANTTPVANGSISCRIAGITTSTFRATASMAAAGANIDVTTATTAAIMTGATGVTTMIMATDMARDTARGTRTTESGWLQSPDVLHDAILRDDTAVHWIAKSRQHVGFFACEQI